MSVTGNLNTPYRDRRTKASRLEQFLTPRKKNRAHERTMAFLDSEGNFVNAVAIVDGTGEMVDLAGVNLWLELIYEELKKLNIQLGGTE